LLKVVIDPCNSSAISGWWRSWGREGLDGENGSAEVVHGFCGCESTDTVFGCGVGFKRSGRDAHEFAALGYKRAGFMTSGLASLTILPGLELWQNQHP
jgi:hypothetical protein